jgi:PKD repeat protein
MGDDRVMARTGGSVGRSKWVGLTLLSALAITGAVTAVSPGAAAVEVRLTAVGDYGARAATSTVLDKAFEIGPDAHLALGDLKYGDLADEQAWCGFVKRHVGEGFPFQLISGNHESEDVRDGQINNFSACLPNQIPGIVGTYGREYYMDFPKGAPLVRVIQTSPHLTFLDGKWTYTQNDVHYNWLSAAIDDGRAKGAQWIIVTGHIPCQTVGTNSCPQPKDFYDLLIAKKVDLVLHGHEHSYARTHQLRAGVSECTTVPRLTFNAACVVDSDSSFVAGQGSVFATVGTGGTPLRDVNPADTEAGYFAAWSGLNSNPTYGLLDIRVTLDQLAANFVPTSGGNFTDSFTITKGPAPVNQPPVAVITTSVSDLTVTASGANSSDPDGTIAGYAWNYGDGATATGATPAPHTYATPGPYTISLTVTDNLGATNTTTANVTAVDPPASTTLARDTFSRTLAAGWGAAELGGTWTVSSSSSLSVDGSSGRIVSPAATGRTAFLRSVTSVNSDLLVTLSSDKITTGGGLFLYAIPRQVSNGSDYRGVLHLRSDGRVGLRVDRGSSVIVPTVIVPGVAYSPNVKLELRVQAIGTSPTTVRARVWPEGTAEPITWTVSTTDSTAGIQSAGWSGLGTWLSSSATNAPVTLSIDEFVLTTP